MKKTNVKAKTSKKTAANSQADQQGLLDLVLVMRKVAERLDGVEKKIEQVIRQTSVGSSGMAPAGQNIQRFNETHGAQGYRSEYQSLNQNQNPQQNNKRHERVMYKAVCADCRKDCEIPFKPTGERPVYCKVCFAKRKDVGRREKTAVEHPVPYNQQSSMKVMTKGADKVAISGAVSSSVHALSKAKSNKTRKKSRT